MRLGIIGLSPGNGHPYSWAAMFNGYDREAMAQCPFPMIPKYLAERRFPRDAIDGAVVTHVWTQDTRISADVALASRIPTVVRRPEQMLGEIDGLLLARDDAESHVELAGPFLRAGLPVYVDKPLALSIQGARALLELRTYSQQIFNCSALRYAWELSPAAAERAGVGTVRTVRGSTPRRWATYSPHVIEPALALLQAWSDVPVRLQAESVNDRTTVDVEWPGQRRAELTALGCETAPIRFEVEGEEGAATLNFADSFAAFRAALREFVAVAKGKSTPPPDDELLNVVRLIEAGERASS